MKNITSSIIIIWVLSFALSNNGFAQTTTKEKIKVHILNIPKIQHKISYEIEGHNGKSFKAQRTDDSPTITYRLENDFKNHAVILGANQTEITKTFDEDIIYLKLRYNPGKNQLFILRRGDEAYIEYSDGKPYMEIQNRVVKEYDHSIVKYLRERGLPDRDFMVYNFAKKEDKNKTIKTYDRLIKSLDSLKKEGLLSDIEHEYYRKSLFYSREEKTKKYKLELLNKPDLHIKSYELYLRQYVFSKLKKKIISLGNGMARNSLESFDFAIKNEHISRQNKKHLLQSYLRGIKIDFSNKTYKDRYAKYESFLSKNGIDGKPKSLSLASAFKNNNGNSKLLKSIYGLTNDVELIDSKGNLTTLQQVLNSHKNKTVYIDFWASWCAPCRAAFPSYKKLKEQYKDKDIVFLFISGDRDPEKWKKAEIKEQLSNSYLATNFPKVKFYEDLQLKSFPRYLIFDKKGELVRYRAPGPDSDNIREILDEIIDK